jgi:uncharacterized membrane protein YecN with MAPEG domain
MGDWIRTTPIWILGVVLFFATVACAYAGASLSKWIARVRGEDGQLSDSQQGYVVSSVFALLALLVAFTFGLAMDRYQTRRQLVVEHANAIEAVYLKSQLLDEPHRSRFASLLVSYAQLQVQLASLRRDDASAQRLLAEDDSDLRNLWTATVAAFQSVKTLDFSSSFVDSVTDLVKVDAQRKAVRRAQIPTTILAALLFYTLVAAGVLGGVMKTRKGRQFSVVLLALNIFALMLITDINRPVEGTIRESQEPMERMLARLQANPPAIYQRLMATPR